MDDFYAWEPKKAFEELGSSQKGLKAEEALKRFGRYGPNELRKEKRKHPIFLFLEQFENFLNILLIIAAVLSFAIGEAVDAVAMLSIVFLSAVLGFFQEYRAEKAVEALQRISAPTARVLRDGVEQRIPARELVPGDVLLLEAGDIVPADARLFEAFSLDIEEAALTGESLPSRKVIEPFRLGTSVADQENMAFAGTVVVYGKGRGVVTKTGMGTELGKIAHSIQETQETVTPLQKKFNEMAKQIGFIVLGLCLIVFLAGILTLNVSLNEMFLVSLSLAVAAVPSSLPAIVTISLGLGVSTLAKKNMIIKKLPAAESLGSVTVICSDKTGTITKNQMTVTKILYENRLIDVSGSGYEPKGSFTLGGKPFDAKQLEPLLRAGFLCNNAKLSEKNGWEIVGDPTEGALIVLGEKAGLGGEDYYSQGYSLVQELPFDSERKMMTKIFSERKSGKRIAFVKGAPDLLLKACDMIYENGRVKRLSPAQKKKILSTQEKMASDALRVLGIAYREVPKAEKHSVKTVEKNLVFLGLTGMMDPPRPEVLDAVEQCRKAGIKVIVISGDYATTTKAVAKQIGLLREGEAVITGEELDKMNDTELEARIERIGIIARALPIQKSRIVDALKRRGHVVAMTGDGVNDAPALKKADIGISMGLTGTDVAREVSKATLADDNFATIVNAIAEGRNIYDKIIKSTRYLLSCNIGEIITVFLAVILKMPLPMRPLQILLMNLFTDGLPAIGLGTEPSEEEVMKRKPRNPKEPIISRRMAVLILLFGIIMGVGTLFLFNIYAGTNLAKAQTVAFTTLVMFEMFAVVGSRSLLPFRKLNPLTNLALTAGIVASVLGQLAIIYWAPLQNVFGTTALALSDWILILGVASLGFLAMEASKFFTKTS